MQIEREVERGQNLADGADAEQIDRADFGELQGFGEYGLQHGVVPGLAGS